MDAVLLGRDGTAYPLDATRWRGDDGSPLTVSALPGIRSQADLLPSRGWTRFAGALPAGLDPVLLGEGGTSLIELRVAGVRLLAKPEWMNPTGSFKDRGVAVMVSALKAAGVREVLEDSSGNGGASVATYGAVAGMRVTILAPESTSPAKLLQARAAGARIELVPGPRQATADAAVRRAEHVVYASHNHSPWFLQGVKLLAYEIWDDLRGAAPQAVLVPAGAGSLVLGLAAGFGELAAAGAIARVPRILAVQPEAVAPLADAFARGLAAADPDRSWGTTIAEGTAIARPVRDVEVLDAVRASGGAIVRVSETAIRDAVRLLAPQGAYVEPTSAQVAAAVPELLERGLLRERETTVAVLTGSGLKTPGPMSAILG